MLKKKNNDLIYKSKQNDLRKRNEIGKRVFVLWFQREKTDKLFCFAIGLCWYFGETFGCLFLFLSFAFMHRVTLFCFGTMKKKQAMKFSCLTYEISRYESKSSMHEILAMNEWNQGNDSISHLRYLHSLILWFLEHNK